MSTATAARPRASGELPQWLLGPGADAVPYAPSGRRRRHSFVTTTLDNAARVLREIVVGEATTRRGRAPRRKDPRVTLGALLASLVAVGLVHHAVPLVAAFAAVVLLAALAAVPVRPFLGRVLVVTLLNLLVVTPAAFSPVVAGTVVVPLWTWDGRPQGLTAQGLASAALVTGRVACSVAVVLLVASTTPGTTLLAGFGRLGAPVALVMTVTMAYRYLYVLAGVMADMSTSRLARTVGRVRHDGGGRAVLGAGVGALVVKSHQLSEEVHQAMVARGYRGRTLTLETYRVTGHDVLGAVLTLAGCAALLVVDGALAR